MKIRYLPLLILGLALALGCQPTQTPNSADFGRFEGDVVASWDDDGRNMTLREEFAYIDLQNRRWTAPAGSVVNGASIPVAFWTFIGGPFEGKYRSASVVHDVGCVEMTQTWEDVHRMFYEACLCGGVDEQTAKVLYYAVYHFGPRWEPVTETVVESRAGAGGQMVEQEVTVQRMARIDPPPPTLEEVEQVEALIADENPELSVIVRTDRQALRRRPRHGSGRGRMAGRPGGPPSSDEGVDRPAWKRPDSAAGGNGRGGHHAGGAGGRVATGGGRPAPKHGHEGWEGGPQGHRPTRQPGGPALPAVTPQEQQWAVEQVRQHLEQQTGQERPAEYEVERTKYGYRIFVQYVQLDEQDQPTSAPGGHSTVRLSRDGKVTEMISGM